MRGKVVASIVVVVLAIGLLSRFSERESEAQEHVELTGPAYYQTWIKQCVEIRRSEKGAIRGGLNRYIITDTWRDMVAGFQREPDLLAALMNDFTKGTSANPQFDIHLHYALMHVFVVDPELPFTWADTSNDPDGIECGESSPRARRYVKRLLEDIEKKGRKPIQRVEATSGTRPEI